MYLPHNLGTKMKRLIPRGKAGKAALIGAGLFGAFKAHPFRETSAAGQEFLYGDPQALRHSAAASFQTNFTEPFQSDYSLNTMEGLRYPGPPGMAAPDGALVFGLYNSRLGG